MALSASDDPRDRQRLRQVGVDEFVLKPSLRNFLRFNSDVSIDLLSTNGRSVIGRSLGMFRASGCLMSPPGRAAIGRASAFGCPITARRKQPMQNRQVNGAFDGELVASTFQLLAQATFNPRGFPESGKDQIRPDAFHGDRFGFTGGMSVDHR